MEQEEFDKVVDTLEDKLGKTLKVLGDDYAAIRAGRANPRVLDRVEVDYYGTATPVNQVANISVQEGKILVIAPWDASMLKNIEKAILTSDVGITPTNDGKVIRLAFPDLTEERRQELTKQARKMGEDAKVASRNIRRDAIETFKRYKTDKEISEDEYDVYEKKIEKAVTEAIGRIDDAVAEKEKELMTV